MCASATDSITIGRALLEQEKDTLIGPELKEAINITEEAFPHFDQHIQKSLDLFRMSKLKIYSKDKMIVYSTDHAIIGKSDHENELLEAALSGDIVSEFERENDVWDLVGEKKFKLDMVETYLPIKDMNNMYDSIVRDIDKSLDIITIRAILACVNHVITEGEGLEDVASRLGPWRKLQFYLTLLVGLVLGAWAVLSRDGAVEAAAGLFLISMAFIMASHRSLSARISEDEARIKEVERKATDYGCGR